MKRCTVILMAVLATLTGCEKRTTLSTWDLPDKDNLLRHGQMLQAKDAPDDMKLLTTEKPSNVSPNIAITKMIQALNSYDAKSNFPYNTTYTINRVNETIINGRKYYAGICEFDFKKANGSDIEELNGISPCIGFVDAEDVSKPAFIRVADSTGKPYQIKIHLESHQVGFLDENHIIKYLHNNGYSNLKTLTKEISKPNLEFDKNWRPYYSSMWLKDDAVGQVGTAYYPLAFVLTDMQTGEVTGYSVDNPLTKDVNEGRMLQDETTKTFDEIPTWVDWVYSKRLFIQMATHFGYPINNYQKRAYKDWLILDGTRVNNSVEVCMYSGCEANPAQVIETSKSKDGKDIIMTAFYTSRSNDLAVNKIIQFNARTGETWLFDRQGSEKSLTVKSAVAEIIQNAAVMKNDYDVEDITINPIFGRLTWHTVITRNLHDNEGYDKTKTGDAETFYSEKDISYSVYAQTCLVEANYDIKISDIICHSDEDILYTMYRNHLYKKDTKYNRSTVLNDSQIEGVVKSKIMFNNYVIIKLENNDSDFIVEVDNIFDQEIGDALTLDIGDNVLIKYGDQVNLSKKPVRLIKKLNR